MPLEPEDVLNILVNSGCSGFAHALATAWGFEQAQALPAERVRAIKPRGQPSRKARQAA